jgi:hypothetical protein
MESCDRCNKSLVGEKSVTARRKDGSTATICLDCASELKGKRSPKPQPEAVSNPEDRSLPVATAAAKKEKKSTDKWYMNVIYGVVCIALMAFVFIQLNQLETGEVASVRIWWPVAAMYNLLGFWGAVACPGLLSFLFFGLGIKQLLAEDNE